MSKENDIQISMNKNIIEMEYAVRGPIPQRAAQLSTEGIKTIPCNIGNPQALGQDPITYYRQVISLVENPNQIEREIHLKKLATTNSELETVALYPDDVLNIAKRYLEENGKGVGAYTESNGPLFIREDIAKFIDHRDSINNSNYIPSSAEKIYITNGASEGVKYAIELLISNPKDGIMIPIPQYPLYSATIRKAGGTQINYYPDEENGWLISKETLKDSYDKAIKDGISVKAIVVINPGNPTGAILSKDTINDIINFSCEHNLVILADEVYQENVYGEKFHSFASVIGKRKVSLLSLHSVSKGFYGECGHRGGYMEVRNPPVPVGTDLTFLELIQKQASVSLCSNTIGQLMIWLMVCPPVEGSPSFELFTKEKQKILLGLEEKANLIREAFIQMKGVEIFGSTGAMYLFPKIGKLPKGTNDFDYCMALLEETGLTTVNGAGFGQKNGTFHLRIAFLPSKKLLAEVLPKWIKFHNEYVN